MLVVKEGHIYSLAHVDGVKRTELVFVCREEHLEVHEGVQTQEVLRALIDRTMHCDNCRRWSRNDEIIHHLRKALLLHEVRALERKFDKGLIAPENIAVDSDGHYRLEKLSFTKDGTDYNVKPKKIGEGP
ncbi:hypothetical protein LCGC14_2659260 [marine sediment metagenome]|uniref:Uncharacterized protein n=1 Tax=marine sediment metagenome TaxID=412755 RepID=A0A0F9CJB8_9ZZZZ